VNSLQFRAFVYYPLLQLFTSFLSSSPADKTPVLRKSRKSRFAHREPYIKAQSGIGSINWKTIMIASIDKTTHAIRALRGIGLVCLFLVPQFAWGDEKDEPTKDGKTADVRRDTTPPRLSLYLPIPLGVPNVESQSTGVFVPENYRAGDTVDVVLFLRGYDIKRPKAATSVEEYWNSPSHPILKSFQFRQEVNKSGKNVVLVVPALGPRSEAGALTEAGGVQKLFNEVLDGLWRNGPHDNLKKRPTIRHLILAAHSGGGVPLRRLAQVLGDDTEYKDKLKECWGFDSIYGVKDKDAEFWSDWAAKHAGCKVSMYYIVTDKEVGKNPKLPVSAQNPADRREPTGTTFPAQELERLAKVQMLKNVRVVRETKDTTLSHNNVPLTHLADLLKGASYLDDR
jgi:hypothetical protein